MSDPNDTRYRDYIRTILAEDADLVLKKDEEYGASWKRRGGPGAYMVMARKMDRLEEQCKKFGYDIFKAMENSRLKEETLMDTIRDLRCYLALIEAEHRAWISTPGPASSAVICDCSHPKFEHDAGINECHNCACRHYTTEAQALKHVGERMLTCECSHARTFHSNNVGRCIGIAGTCPCITFKQSF